MRSSDVRFVRERAVHGVDRVRAAGVTSGRIEPPTVDRLEWLRDPRAAREPKPGDVDPDAVASGRWSTLHLATDHAGVPCFVRRSTEARASRFAVDHRTGARHLAGVTVPALGGTRGPEVWMDRLPWADVGVVPDPMDVDAYVVGAVRAALVHGVLVGTGAVHVDRYGRLVCEDLVVAGRLEVDERRVLAAALHGLAERDATLVADSVAEMIHLRTPRLVGCAISCVRSLQVRWEPVAFGLAVHSLGRASLEAGRRSDPLVLLGDELLHRLDLAHEHRIRVPGFATPDRVAVLASGGSR